MCYALLSIALHYSSYTINNKVLTQALWLKCRKMAPTYAKLPVDSHAYQGFASILYKVLDSLGVPIDQIQYMCRGEVGSKGFKDHIVVRLLILASTYVPILHAFETLEVENSIGTCVQSILRPALRCVMRDARDYLQTGPYRLLPAALDLNKSLEP